MAEIVRSEPRSELTSLRDAIDRLFEDSFVGPGVFGLSAGPAALVPLDVYETRDKLVVKLSVPGVKPEDIDVTVTGDLLTIKGEFKSEETTEKRHYLLNERRAGSFCRQVALPMGVNADKVSATYEGGVLVLEMPKAEGAKSKSIKIVAK